MHVLTNYCSLTLAFSMNFTQALANVTRAQVQVCPGVARPLVLLARGVGHSTSYMIPRASPLRWPRASPQPAKWACSRDKVESLDWTTRLI